MTPHYLFQERTLHASRNQSLWSLWLAWHRWQCYTVNYDRLVVCFGIYPVVISCLSSPWPFRIFLSLTTYFNLPPDLQTPAHLLRFFLRFLFLIVCMRVCVPACVCVRVGCMHMNVSIHREGVGCPGVARREPSNIGARNRTRVLRKYNIVS